MVTYTTQGVGYDSDVKAPGLTASQTEGSVENHTGFDPLSAAAAAAIVASAQQLLLAAGRGQTNAALKGKQLALMCALETAGDAAKADSESADAAFFRQAATRLGAHVARIRPRLTASSSASELRRLAFMLGRLYDAVECQGMSADLTQKIRSQAGVPVYFRLASKSHPTAALAGQLKGSAAPRDKRLFVLQAALLRSLELGT
ncbi:MAG: ornithine carbamoyltransferase [Pseudorhodobacter sp.]|nr:ornithine carbamoyltransferase [Rhizobacter sp.]